jgi:hypothetical protein
MSENRTVNLQNQRKSTGLSSCGTRGSVQDCHPAEPEEEYRQDCHPAEPEEVYRTVILQNQRKSTGQSSSRVR